MPRVSDQDIKEAVDKMAQDTGLPLEPYWGNGLVKILIAGQQTKHGRGRSEFSHTFDTNGELMVWIDAFMQGWQMRGMAPTK